MYPAFFLSFLFRCAVASLYEVVSVRPSVCTVLFSKVKRTHTRRILCRVSGLVSFLPAFLSFLQFFSFFQFFFTFFLSIILSIIVSQFHSFSFNTISSFLLPMLQAVQRWAIVSTARSPPWSSKTRVGGVDTRRACTGWCPGIEFVTASPFSCAALAWSAC